MPARRSAEKRRIDIPSACRQTRARLFDFLDGELDGESHRAVQRHLDYCVDCRREWESQRRAEQALSTGRQNIPDPGDLRSGFYARLAATAPRRRPALIEAFRRAPFPALALPAVALALLIGMQYGRGKITGATRPIGAPELATAPDRGSALITEALPSSFAPTGLPHWVTTPRLNPIRIASNIDVGLSRSSAVTVATQGVGGHRPTISPSRNQSEAPAWAGAPKVAAKYPGSLPVDSSAAKMSRQIEPSRDANLAYKADVDAAAGSFAYQRNVEELAKLADGSPTSPVSSTRAELMSEEISIHIVNDKNEDVNSIDVGSAVGTADQASVIHVEADANIGGATAEVNRP
jgi:hypothetical protein